jgi:formylglycine-generating enzyme required for sulfatase activity
MVALSAGSFKKAYPIPDEPDENVTVRTFCIDLTEVTVGAYAACVREGRCTADHPGARRTEGGGTFSQDARCNYGVAGKSSHPMNCVDWSQAVGYCNAMNKRLPSERESEWAARGGEEGRLYPWGETPPDSQLCWAGNGGRLGTCPVGSFSSGDTKSGIHDLAGNVEEWTSNRSADMLPPNSLELSTACGISDDCRVTRGGSWDDLDATSFRAGFSRKYPSTYRNFFLGFRCAK